MEKQKLKTLQKKLKYKFKDRELLTQALTHPSFVQGTEHSNNHYQRLEFLGDAVLGMVVADELFTTYPNEREGFLTKARSSICHGKGLTRLAKKLDLQDYLRLGKGEKKGKSKDRSQVLGDCLEALIGAVYLDGGYKPARRLIISWLDDQLDTIHTEMVSINHKGTLQEWSQAHYGKNRFHYEMEKASGPDHAKEFTVSIQIDGSAITKATGFSKKEAESLAAQEVLKIIDSQEDVLPDWEAILALK